MDQNEKLTKFGFKILAVIEAFSKWPIYWKVKYSPLVSS